MCDFLKGMFISADFRLVKRGKKSCITFNNTYSLMVQGNKVSFVVSENTKETPSAGLQF